MIKRNISVFLATLTVVSFVSFKSYATEISDEKSKAITIINKEDDLVITEYENVIEPYDAMYITNEIWNNSSTYEKYFSAVKNNGNTLNINVQNNGRTDVYFEVYKKNILGKYTIQGSTITVSPGTAPTKTFTSSSGISGDFKVRVYTNTSEKMNLCIRARQF